MSENTVDQNLMISVYKAVYGSDQANFMNWRRWFGILGGNTNHINTSFVDLFAEWAAKGTNSENQIIKNPNDALVLEDFKKFLSEKLEGNKSISGEQKTLMDEILRLCNAGVGTREHKEAIGGLRIFGRLFSETKINKKHGGSTVGKFGTFLDKLRTLPQLVQASGKTPQKSEAVSKMAPGKTEEPTKEQPAVEDSWVIPNMTDESSFNFEFENKEKTEEKNKQPETLPLEPGIKPIPTETLAPEGELPGTKTLPDLPGEKGTALKIDKGLMKLNISVKDKNKKIPESETTTTSTRKGGWAKMLGGRGRMLKEPPKPLNRTPKGLEAKSTASSTQGKGTEGSEEATGDEVPTEEKNEETRKPAQPQKEERPKKKGMPGPIKIGFWGSIFGFLGGGGYIYAGAAKDSQAASAFVDTILHSISHIAFIVFHNLF